MKEVGYMGILANHRKLLRQSHEALLRPTFLPSHIYMFKYPTIKPSRDEHFRSQREPMSAGDVSDWHRRSQIRREI